MKALSIRQPWAWLLAHGYKDIENRSWDTQFRGRFLIHAAKKIDLDGYHWVKNNFPGIALPTEFDRSGFVGAGTITESTIISASRWFSGPYGFKIERASSFDFIPFPGRLGFFKPLGDYSVRSCRGHWHVTVGEEEDDLMLDGDPYKSMHDAIVAALAHKEEMDADRESFRQSQIVSGEATRRELGKLLRRARMYGE